MTVVTFRRGDLAWTIIFSLLVFITQYGSLTREVIDWDESTFIVMAQDVLRHHLPYIPLFDNKPPGIFLALAATMEIFGESLTTVRLFGDSCLLLAAVATYAATKRFVDHATAGLSTCVMIAAASASFGLHTSTEKPVMFLLAGVLWMLVSYGDKGGSPFFAGIFLSAAVLIRTNIAFVGVSLGILFIVGFFRPSLRLSRLSALYFIAGGSIPLTVMLAIYAYADGIDAFVLCAVTVPLLYSRNGLSLLHALVKNIDNALLPNFPYSANLFALLSLAGLFALAAQALRKHRMAAVEPSTAERDVLIVLTTFLATSVSILKSGEAYSHYLLQLYPFGGIFTALALKPPICSGKPLFARCLSCLAIAGAVMSNGPATARVVFERAAVEDDYTVWKAALKIAGDRQPGDRIWAMDYHLILFYLNEPPISPVVTQPDSIVRPVITLPLVQAGFVSTDEISKIFASAPRYIVTRDEGLPSYFPDPIRAEYSELFSKNYELWFHDKDLYVYKIIDLPQERWPLRPSPATIFPPT